MNPFKRLKELDRLIATASRKTGKAARFEAISLKEELDRINRIISANPGLVIVR